MTKFVSGIKSLFSGPDTSAQEQQAAQEASAREAQSISLQKQQETLQNQDATQQSQLGRVARAPRGRRLLLAATGEQGVSTTLGG
jgi:Sec-independent protein translocase protein TatA